jgi:competence protein ComEA
MAQEATIDMLNNASADELRNIEGIDDQRAEEIVRYREQNGNFSSWDDLKNIPGFSDEMVNAIRTRGGDWGSGGNE